LDRIHSKRIQQLVVNFKAKSPRLCRLRIRGAFFNYTITCAYAPTEDKDGEENDDSLMFFMNAHEGTSVGTRGKDYKQTKRRDINLLKPSGNFTYHQV
jgi:hypothetical protein